MADYTLNKTGAQIDAIGTIVSSSSTLNGIASSTYTNLCTITLPKGVWVITGQVRLNPGANNMKLDASISTASADIGVTSTGLVQIQVPASSGICSVSLTRISEFTASTTVYLVARQASGSTISITGGQQILKAVRIA